MVVCVGGGGLQNIVVPDRLAAPTVEHECGGSGAFTPASVSITQLKSALDRRTHPNSPGTHGMPSSLVRLRVTDIRSVSSWHARRQ